MTGLSHPYHLDESTYIFRGIRSHFSFLFHFSINKNIIMSSFKSSEDIQRKRVGQTAVSDNQSSSVTLNQLANKARKINSNFEFQRRSHTMTERNLNRVQTTKTV